MPRRGQLFNLADRVVREYHFSSSTKSQQCCYRTLELVLAPIFISVSVILNILCICKQTWVNGYLHIGTHFVQLSPWYICVNPCPGGLCPDTWVRGEPASQQTAHAGLDCFWMNDWTGTEFGQFSAVQQLEYWGLAVSILAMGFSVVLCLDKRGHICVPYGSMSVAVLLLVSVCLSVSSVTVFVTSVQPGVKQIAGGHPVQISYSWIFYCRCLSVAVCIASLACFGMHWWRTKSERYFSYNDEEDDKMTIVSLNADDMDGQCLEQGEQL